MTTFRIAHADPRPGQLDNGEFQTLGWLIVLADDAGHRAVPVWLRGEPGAADLARLVELAGQPDEEIVAADVPEGLTARLLRAAGASVTEVHIDLTEADADELSPRGTVARIGLSGPAGHRQVTATLGLGLAVAAAAGAPVMLADEVTDRVAVPVSGDDLLGPLLGHVPPLAQVPPGRGLAGWLVATLPAKRPRFEPRNLDFGDGLDRWCPARHRPGYRGLGRRDHGGRAGPGCRPGAGPAGGAATGRWAGAAPRTRGGARRLEPRRPTAV
jgi:hypothetical protein